MTGLILIAAAVVAIIRGGVPNYPLLQVVQSSSLLEPDLAPVPFIVAIVTGYSKETG